MRRSFNVPDKPYHWFNVVKPSAALFKYPANPIAAELPEIIFHLNPLKLSQRRFSSSGYAIFPRKLLRNGLIRIDFHPVTFACSFPHFFGNKKLELTTNIHESCRSYGFDYGRYISDTPSMFFAAKSGAL